MTQSDRAPRPTRFVGQVRDISDPAQAATWHQVIAALDMEEAIEFVMAIRLKNRNLRVRVIHAELVGSNVVLTNCLDESDFESVLEVESGKHQLGVVDLLRRGG